MRWNEIGDTECSIARALAVVGDRWTLLVLREAFTGVRRFDDLQANTGMSRHLLADRLRSLTDEGVLRRVRYQERPERFEYRLTEAGLDLYPVIVGLLAWGDRWAPRDSGPSVILEHMGCEQLIHPALVCPECGERVGARDVRMHLVEPSHPRYDTAAHHEFRAKFAQRL